MVIRALCKRVRKFFYRQSSNALSNSKEDVARNEDSDLQTNKKKCFYIEKFQISSNIAYCVRVRGLTYRYYLNFIQKNVKYSRKSKQNLINFGKTGKRQI